MTTSSHSIPQSSASSSDAPRDLQAEERIAAFDVLIEAIASLSQAGSLPVTGSAVRLEMGRLTYGGFDPKRVGYKRFRDFLDDAEGRGHVEIDRDRPGDVAVAIPGSSPEAGFTSRMRSDLWKAFSDWNPRTSRFYDLNEDRVVTLPTEPAPLEPTRYTEIRKRISENSSGFVEIKSISRQKQLDWMRDFALLVTDPEVSRVLTEALKSDHPARYFVVVLRSFPSLLNRWHNTLRERVYAEVLKWRDSDSRLATVQIDQMDSSASPPPTQLREEPVGLAGTAGRRVVEGTQKHAHDLDVVQFFASQTPGKVAQSRSPLRQRLHEAIERMPESELRKISIPVGYLFED
ncbi:UPF0158 family protein [Actinacidiphila bryophytorum]|uniref:UPF0158 family protein n=1 Tax=Actinacidiphila bryophytorum TaxID=1436133 RepID=UPI002176E503|nr:UPF0158 family protein [Actinacidiphila bryophytorum]UWE13065.1 UPF0158 family protein [Actinacidiphila bryophytorum]